MTSNLPTLPDGWEWKTVGEIISNIQTGTTPSKQVHKYYTEAFVIDWYSPSDFTENKILFNPKNRLNQLCVDDRKVKLYEENSLLLVAIGATIGKIGIIRKKATSNQQITALKFKDFVDIDFAFYWFTFIRKTIIEKASTATLPIINQSGIKELPFILPPLNEQKRLVALLDTLFAKIDRSLELLNENITAADALLPSALNTVFGELGEHLEIVNVEKALSNIQTGTTPSKQINKYYQEPQTIDWFSPSDFTEEKILTSSKNKLNQFAADEKKVKYYKENSLLLVAIGATVGKIGIIREQATSNQQITALKFNNDVLVDFAYYWFKHIKETIIGKVSTATMPIINQSGIKSLPILIPPLDIQTQSVAYLDSIREKVEILKQVQNDKTNKKFTFPIF